LSGELVRGSAGGEEGRGYLVGLLARRARNALARAKRNLEVGDYDGAVFDAEQAAELYLMATVLEYSGETPRSRSLMGMLRTVGELLGFAGEVEEFIRRNRSGLHVLEDAYYSARYLPREFEREDAEGLVALAEEVIGLVEARRARVAPRGSG